MTDNMFYWNWYAGNYWNWYRFYPSAHFHAGNYLQYTFMLETIHVTAGPIPNNACSKTALPKQVGVFLHPFNLKDGRATECRR